MVVEAGIIAHLRQRLVNGAFEPGQRLKADVLRADYGCSASAMRECLFRLSTEGLVDFLEQRGFRLPQVSRQRQHELTHLRILLECEGASLSIRLGGVAWEAQLSAAHHKLRHIEARVNDSGYGDGLLELWSDAELEFHQTLIGACGSSVLKRTHAIIYHQFRQQLITSDRHFLHVPKNVPQHQAIVDAALERNEPLVRQRITEHLSRHLIGAAAGGGSPPASTQN